MFGVVKIPRLSWDFFMDGLGRKLLKYKKIKETYG